jgi:hypothetical protein
MSTASDPSGWIDSADEREREARILLKAGARIYPLGEDKKPLGRWSRGRRNWVRKPATITDVNDWLARLPVKGWAVLCGSKDDGIAAIDIEQPGMEYPQCLGVLSALPASCQRPSRNGGAHAYLNVTDGEPLLTEKLARASGELLAEVRGVSEGDSAGAYAVITGPGRGRLAEDFAFATVSRERADSLLDMVRALHEDSEQDEKRAANRAKSQPSDGAKRGSTSDVLYRAVESGRLDWLDVLEPGWSKVQQVGDVSYFLRPGDAKSEQSGNALGASLTIHSAEVSWAPTSLSMNPARVLAECWFAGDHGAAMRAVEAAARDLIEDGVLPDAPFDRWRGDVLAEVHAAREAARAEYVTQGQGELHEFVAAINGDEDQDGSPDGASEPTPKTTAEPRTLDEVRTTFAAWFGPKFDMQYLDVLLAAAASGLHTSGDPCWLLVVGGAGVGKTEALSSTERAGCMVVSTISSEAALLSGTSRKDVVKSATGGILRTIGDRGTLIIKDFTSILSMRNDDKNAVLAALREAYDGTWVRTLGVDGGRTLRWQGRLTVIGGVTSAYDQHHGVIAAMGDRFLLLRVDSDDEDVRRHAARQSMMNSGGEDAMRGELGEVVAGFLLNLDVPDLPPPDDLIDELIDVADVITRARSQVAADYKGDPEWAHAPEMPTRVAKQLVQLWRGARITGQSDADARRIVRRVAHDTIPPGRRLPLLDVIDHPGSTSAQVAARIGMSRTSTDRRLQELALHKLVQHAAGGQGQAWQWHPVAGRVAVVDLLRTGVGSTAFQSCPENDQHAGQGAKEGVVPSQMGLDEPSEGITHSPTYFSGQPSHADPAPPVHACAGSVCRVPGCERALGPDDLLEEVFRG